MLMPDAVRALKSFLQWLLLTIICRALKDHFKGKIINEEFYKVKIHEL